MSKQPRNPGSARTVRESAAAYGGDAVESPTKTGNADGKGRVNLGIRFANKLFRISEQPDGNVLLEPIVAVHERELWFFKNPEAQAMVQEGIKQSQAGKGEYLGSFTEYADADEVE